LKAAFKAFVFNKISDCFILLGTIILINLMLEANIVTINETISLYAQSNINFIKNNLNTLESVAFCFMISAFIKSAQFGFHIWLPDSMEAPVPASALIHSATLVSAGIFLILRLYPLFELTPYIKNYILFFGSLTAFFGGVCAVFQTDVKRLLAYSTISHCGVLMFLTFFKNPDIVIIYLYTHGLFKALIFMCMGHVIRFANNYQDMRRMGGFYKYLPFEANVSLICLANLGGVSFT
jgi:NADH-quinone oxidoreductase subunit L